MPYIDSEFLKKKIFPYGMADNGNYEINAKSVMVAIEKTPEIDVVEVVRCKDFRHFVREFDGVGHCSYAGIHLDHMETGFCSYGERRGG